MDLVSPIIKGMGDLIAEGITTSKINITLIDRKQIGMDLSLFDLTIDNHQTTPFL